MIKLTEILAEATAAAFKKKLASMADRIVKAAEVDYRSDMKDPDNDAEGKKYALKTKNDLIKVADAIRSGNLKKAKRLSDNLGGSASSTMPDAFWNLISDE